MAASRRKAAAFSWAVESLLRDLWGGEAEIAKACSWGLQSAGGCCRYNNLWHGGYGNARTEASKKGES